MNGLADELFHHTFSYLGMKDRVNCALVCRKWWSVLEKRSLFRSVDIYTEIQLNRFLDVIWNSHCYPPQVQEFNLQCMIPHNFDKRWLCSFFPNLQHISFTMPALYPSQSEPLDIPRIESKIKYIYECQGFEFILQMVYLHQCHRLEYLNLAFSGAYREDKTSRILSQLTNMPVLKELRLTGIYLKLSDLETIHNNIPSIQKLELIVVSLWSSEALEDIIPAGSLKELSFRIDDWRDNIDICRFYQYLSKKYVNVVTWNCIANLLDHYDEDSTRIFYETAYLPYLQFRGRTLDEVKFRFTPEELDVFQALDDGDSQVKRVVFQYCYGKRLLEYLAQSNQSKYVQSISIMCTRFDSLRHLESMMALTTLELINIDSVNLADYLNNCPPTLKDFSLDYRNEILELDPSKINVTSIENLTVCVSIITRELGDTISLCFPELSRLILIGRILQNVTIAPKSPQLQTVEFRPDSWFDKFWFLLNRNNQSCLCGNSMAIPAAYDASYDLPELSFKYFPMQELTISDTGKVILSSN